MYFVKKKEQLLRTIKCMYKKQNLMIYLIIIIKHFLFITENKACRVGQWVLNTSSSKYSVIFIPPVNKVGGNTVFHATFIDTFNFTILTLGTYSCHYFYAPGLKGQPGASSNRIVRLSVHLSVRLSVRNSVPLTKKCIIYNLVYDTVTKLGL